MAIDQFVVDLGDMNQYFIQTKEDIEEKKKHDKEDDMDDDFIEDDDDDQPFKEIESGRGLRQIPIEERPPPPLVEEINLDTCYTSKRPVDRR